MDYKLIFNVVAGVLLGLVLFNFLIFIFNKKKRDLFDQKINAYIYLLKDRYFYYANKLSPTFDIFKTFITFPVINKRVKNFLIYLSIKSTKNKLLKLIEWPVRIISFIVYVIISTYIMLFILVLYGASVFVTGSYIFYLFDDKKITFVEYGNNIVDGTETDQLYVSLSGFFTEVAYIAGVLFLLFCFLGLLGCAWALIVLTFTTLWAFTMVIYDAIVSFLKKFFK